MYATLDELTEYLDPASPPSDATRRLERASRQVDQELLCAVYDVDDPAIQKTLRDATLEQVAAMITNGDTGGGPGSGIGSFSIGSISVNRASAGSPAAPRRTAAGLYEQAFAVLQQAGLTGHEPWAL